MGISRYFMNYPLVNVNKKRTGKIHHFIAGIPSTISTGPFSSSQPVKVYQRVYSIDIPIDLQFSNPRDPQLKKT